MKDEWRLGVDAASYVRGIGAFYIGIARDASYGEDDTLGGVLY